MVNENENSVNGFSAEESSAKEEYFNINDGADELNDANDVDDTEELDVSEAVDAPVDGEAEKMSVVGVRFKPTGKAYYFSPNGFELKIGDNVVVETARGLEYGTISFPARDVSVTELLLPIREVMRIATPDDTARRAKNAEIEKNAAKAFNDGVEALRLEMRLLDVECAFDQSKLIFNFSAATRIDFRELVRELASQFHTRIELKQVASRDATKLIGGLGICGRPFCCSTFLTGIVHASIKMAKDQNLSLNSAKISGACGRLMCCLKFEHSTYLKEKELTPRVGEEVMTPEGEGVVFEASPMTGLVKVKLAGSAEDDAPIVFLRDDLVLKSKYRGEVLTRTPIPEKRRSAPASATFEVHSPFSDTVGAVAVEANTEAQSKQQVKTANSDDKKKRDNRAKGKDANRQSNAKPMSQQAVEDKAETAEADERSDRSDKLDKNRNGGKFDKNGKRGKNQNRPNRPNRQGQSDDGAVGEGGSKNENKKPFKSNSEGGQKKENNTSAGSMNAPQNASNDHNHEGREGGRKYHKPYYRRGKHGGNGSNKSGNGNA